MSQRQSLAKSRHSVYSEDNEGERSSATELRDSTAVVPTRASSSSAATVDKDYGATTPENEKSDQDLKPASTPTTATGNEEENNFPNDGRGQLTWKDRNGVVYRYYDNPLISVCPFILVQELCERLAYYGLTPTLKPFLKKTLNVGDAQASSLLGYQQALIFVFPLISSAIADTFLGVYKTILTFSVVYACGLGLTDLSAIESISSPWMVYVALFVLLPIGAGGIKSCVSVFGAQQLHPSAQRELTTSYFNYFYASINVGSLIGGIACPQVQHDVSFFAAYLIPFCSFLAACTVFISGSKRYIYFKPQGSPVVECAKVYWSAIKNKSFDATKKSKGGEFEDADVDDARQLLSLQPICCLSVFMLVAYNNMTTAFLTQGEKMSNLIFGHDFAPAMMQNVDAISVIVTSLIVERWFYPFLRKHNFMPSVIARFAIGNAIAIIALISAFLVELQVMTQVQPNTISIWWQIPQFALIAVAEIFVISTSYEIAFTMAPARLKAMASGCNLLWFSAAGLISGLLFEICSSWMPDFNVNDYSSYQQSHYDYYFLLLAGLCGFGVLMCLALRNYYFRLAGDKEATEEARHTVVVSDDDAKLGSEEAALLDHC